MKYFSPDLYPKKIFKCVIEGSTPPIKDWITRTYSFIRFTRNCMTTKMKFMKHVKCFSDMLMEAISTYREFNLHLSVTRGEDICHSHENTYKRPL